MIFDELKKGFRSSIKDHIIDLDEIHNIKTLLLITDNFDHVEERVSSLNRISSILESNLIKLYLYDMTNLLTHETIEKSWIIDLLKAHSANIRSLKENGFKIILEATVRAFLLELRTARNTTTIGSDSFGSDEIEALADFLVSAPTRQRNFISSILNSIFTNKPDLIYWKPPFLTNRDEPENQNLIRNFSLNLIRELPSDPWIFLEGNKKLDEVHHVLSLLFGGQDNLELHEVVYCVNSLFHKIQKTKLAFLVHIDEYEFSLAKMIAENTVTKLTTDSGTNSLEKTPQITDKLVQTLVSDKYKSMIDNLRISHEAIEYTISFDDLNVLQTNIRSMNPDCLVLHMKKGSEQQFIDRIIAKANMALNHGISVLIV